MSTPVRRHRRRSRARIAARRGVAVALAAGALALLFWVGRAALDDGDDPAPIATTTPAAVRPPKPLRIVFPEGFTRREMAARIGVVNQIARRKRGVRPKLSPGQYLAVTRRAPLPKGFRDRSKRRRLEGFLFPATYEFLPRTTSRQLVNQQLKAFKRNWRKVELGYARSKNLTSYDVLVIASMIEEEVSVPAERRLVASVIYNRLRRRMPLGIDATIRYALGVPPTESLKQSQLRNPTPYNTRIHRGLPPTPITNPGLASIRAAARPARTNYLYFVRKPDKMHHFFTASESEFLEYQREHGYS